MTTSRQVTSWMLARAARPLPVFGRSTAASAVPAAAAAARRMHPSSSSSNYYYYCSAATTPNNHDSISSRSIRNAVVVSSTPMPKSKSKSTSRYWFSSSSNSNSNTTTPSGDDKTTNEEPTAGEGEGDDASAPNDEEAAAAAAAAMEQAQQAEIKQLKDQLLRSYAEQENTRNIAKRDVSEARQFAIKSFAKSLLEVADNLQRALDSVPPPPAAEELAAQESSSSTTSSSNSHANLIALHQGIEMTNVGLIKALQQNGVEKYCEVPGDKFDPALHNALMQYPDPDKAPDTVGQVIKVGYTLNKRVLRPAEVAVVVKKA